MKTNLGSLISDVFFQGPTHCLPYINSSPPSDAYMLASVNRIRIGSDKGLLPIQRQAIILTKAGLSMRPLGTNFIEILIKVQ